MNGRLQRDLPRSANIKAHSEQDFEQITMNHNMTPRICLDGFSSIEALVKPQQGYRLPVQSGCWTSTLNISTA